MQLDPKLMSDLQEILKEKQGYIRQFQAHYVLQKRWGFHKLAAVTKKILDDERDHLKSTLHYIAQRDGIPNMNQHDDADVGATVPEQINNDLDNEKHCVTLLNRIIADARNANEDSMRRMVEHIVKDDEKHVAKFEKQKKLIETLGVQNYLTRMSKA